MNKFPKYRMMFWHQPIDFPHEQIVLNNIGHNALGSGPTNHKVQMAIIVSLAIIYWNWQARKKPEELQNMGELVKRF